MTQKIYKTAQGKSVDMGRLALQNEKTRAVGNMKVNARGDVVNDNNKVIAKKNEQVNRQYNKQVKSTNRGPQ
jgi:glycine cleavage system H lipoate-binding protein